MRVAPKRWVIGIDEVGRGPLAGPVYVCAVAMEYQLYKKMKWPGLTDSKKLSLKAREHWFTKAKELESQDILKIALAHQSAAAIDRYGISVCIKKCIVDILEQVALDPSETLVLLDGGLRAPTQYTTQQTIIRGDQSQKIISLASVVAKVTRDRYMVNMAQKYPEYAWQNNKGYGTKMHSEALKKRGITSLHRKSFLSRILDINQ
jgi:ribonuclease HII